MSSKETPGASSSRGTAIPLEGTTAGTGNLGNRTEEVDSALKIPIAGGFKLEILQDVDNSEGEYKAQLVLGRAAPEHDLPEPAPVPDLASELSEKIVDKFYENRFQELETDKAHACEDDLEDYYRDYSTTDDDD